MPSEIFQGESIGNRQKQEWRASVYVRLDQVTSAQVRAAPKQTAAPRRPHKKRVDQR